jgi:hypothetical protein
MFNGRHSKDKVVKKCSEGSSNIYYITSPSDIIYVIFSSVIDEHFFL